MKTRIILRLAALLGLLALASSVVAQTSAPLSINCPPNRTNWHCGVASTAIVTYPAPTTTASCPTNAVVTCTPPSGGVFILGTTTVTCRATNSCRESAVCSFTVTVARDTIPPVIQCPTNRIVWLCGTATTTAVVSWPLPSATDNADTSVAVTCSPPSGSIFPLGTTTVTCTATDDCTNRTTCTFLVRVTRDTTPPIIQCPSNIVVLACDRTGAVVNYLTPTATDNLDPTPVVACEPGSGKLFPVGNTTVTCTATDDCTNRSTCSFTVTVNADTTPPVIQCPSNIVLWTCSTGAVTHYGVTATDDFDTNVTITCTPPVGTPLPVGETTVNCEATDDCRNTSQCSFRVRVIRDTTPPVITCPSNIVLNCLCPGTVINLDFFQATAVDDHDPSPAIVCDPPSLVSSPGVHVVTCTATDNCGNSNRCSFTVTFNYDTTPPVINCPTNMIVRTCDDFARVNYSASATDTCTASVNLVCTPPSGGMFPAGQTTVTCIAIDNCTNRSTCTFTVTVSADTTPPLIQCPTNVTVWTSDLSGRLVCYTPPVVTDDQDSEARARCVPPPGSLFPVGTTPVVCTALDACGNQRVCTFMVEVVLLKLHIAHAASGPVLSWTGGATLEAADEVSGPWLPIRGASSPYPVQPVTAKRFFRLFQVVQEGDGCCGGIVADPGDIAYVSVGLTPLFGEDGIAGLPLFRQADDNDTTGGAMILGAADGGGLDKNCWSDVVNIPFPFRFYGQPFTQFCVSKHGLLTFSTEVAGQGLPTTPLSIDVNWPMPNQYYPLNTIACFHGRFRPLESGHDVRAWLYGDAPHRQAWIIWGGHPKLQQGSTYAALVLEEGSDNIVMMDMYSENDMFQHGKGNLSVGIQKDMNTWRDIPASPLIPIINRSLRRDDNDYWIFRPYVVGRNAAGCAAQGLEAVDDLIAQQLKKDNVPGITVAASVNGRLVLNKGYGYSNVEQGRPMMPWHRAGIGSCSKVITAAGIMKLWEDGTLSSLDAPIYLDPNILLKPYALDGISEGIDSGVHDAQDFIRFQQISTRHLLTHTSGFTGSIDDVEAAELYNNGDYLSAGYDVMIRHYLARVQLGSDPGTVTDYCNENFGHLGQIIREVSGMDYEPFMRQVLQLAEIDAMRVSRSWWHEQEPIDSKRYAYYDSGMPQKPSKIDGVTRSSVYGNGKPYGPQGSWTSSAADLVRFMCGTDRRAKPYDVPDILTDATLDVMESVPFPDSTGDPMAHGWDIISNPNSSDYGKLAHGGAHDAARAYMAKYPDGINVAIVVNTGKGDYTSEANQIRNIIKGALDQGKIPVWFDLFP